MEHERYDLTVFKDHKGQWSVSCHDLGYTTIGDTAYEAVKAYIERWPMTLKAWVNRSSGDGGKE